MSDKIPALTLDTDHPFEALRPDAILRLAALVMEKPLSHSEDMYASDILSRVQLSRELIGLSKEAGDAVRHTAPDAFRRWYGVEERRRPPGDASIYGRTNGAK